MVIRTIVAALAGGYLLERLHVPAGALIGAMIAVAALNLSGLDTYAVPEWARFLAFAGIGWALGQQFTRGSLATLRESFVPILAVVAGLLLAGGLIMLFLRATGLDPATAFLAAAPGGISQMAALSAAIGANASVVMTAHLVRIITVVITAPIVVKLLDSN
jgi:membrane AbrB-like protein